MRIKKESTLNRANLLPAALIAGDACCCDLIVCIAAVICAAVGGAILGSAPPITGAVSGAWETKRNSQRMFANTYRLRSGHRCLLLLRRNAGWIIPTALLLSESGSWIANGHLWLLWLPLWCDRHYRWHSSCLCHCKEVQMSHRTT